MRLAFVLLIGVLGLADAAFAATYDFRMISSGPNRPGLPLGSSPYRDLLVGLHARRSPGTLARTLGMDADSLDRSLARLRGEGLVREAGRATVPTCMIVTAEEGARLASLAGEVAREALPDLRDALARLQEAAKGFDGLRGLPEGEVAFFLASDVLLDNWQIPGVERDWLRAERPLRGRSRYYAALLARPDGDLEPFGIYGNQVVAVGEDRLLGIYGNRRGSAGDLSRLSTGRLRTMAAVPDSIGRTGALGRVLDAIVRASTGDGSGALPASIADGLGEIGLLEKGRPRVAVLDTTDYRRLSGLAASWRPTLVRRLVAADARLRRAWTRSGWHDEVTFEEFRIWWYHFFYTALTDQLAAEGRLSVPGSGLFHYVVVP